MQGIPEFIPTDTKAHYINSLLKVGFDTLDFGSFVSPKYIPQMRDTAEVLSKLDLDNTDTKLSVIIPNVRGAEDAVQYDEIDYLGFPFSISETFQQKNTNASRKEALKRIGEIRELCVKHNKEFVVYLSMAFGNPYGDKWDVDIAGKWLERIAQFDLNYISLSDTVGVANAETSAYMFGNLTKAFPKIEFGAHFHTTATTWKSKVEPAYQNGCKRFDGAIKGYGGCPMAKDELVGNMPTEKLLAYFQEIGEETGLDQAKFDEAMLEAGRVFPLSVH